MTKYEIAKKTLEQLNQFYPAGLYEWLFQYRKSKYNKLVQLESGIDEVMLKEGKLLLSVSGKGVSRGREYFPEYVFCRFE